MATHDALTKLPNRILFRDRLEQAQEGYQRTKTPFAAMLIDLDDFKPINDKYGHDAGDKLLTAVAVRMKRILRANDTIARIGGDEFAAILTDTGGVGGAAIVAEKLVNELKAPVKIGDVTVTVGASIGVAMFPDQTSNIDELMKYADNAMYRAKRSGKTKFMVYNFEDK